MDGETKQEFFCNLLCLLFLVVGADFVSPSTLSVIVQCTDCKIRLKVKGEVVPENRAEIESSIKNSLKNVVAPDSVEVSEQHHAFFPYLYIFEIIEAFASNFTRQTQLKALFQKQKRECIISQTNMK